MTRYECSSGTTIGLMCAPRFAHARLLTCGFQAVKEHGGDRGWVPSWFIGKASSSSNSAGTPATPIAGPTINTSAAAAAAATSLLDTELRYAASSVESPLSPGFPHVAQAPRTAGFI